MVILSSLGKFQDGIVYLILRHFSRKGNPKKAETVYLGTRPEFLRKGTEVLVAFGEKDSVAVDSDTEVAQGMFYKTRWPKRLIGKTLWGIMDENVVYDHNLNPKK